MPEKLTVPAAEITVESLFESMEVILHETQKVSRTDSNQ